MCGGEGSLRIEPTENGFVIDAYTPGSDEPGKAYRPGQHRRLIATTHEQALKLSAPHLKGIAKKSKKKSPKQAEVKGSTPKAVERKRA